ncbi:unnamed protein product [Sphagnum balticum]
MARISDDTDLHYTVLTQEQLMTELMGTIAQVQSIVQLPLTSCRALLAHFKWDKDRMLEARLITDVAVKSRYQQLITNSFVNCAHIGVAVEKRRAQEQHQKEQQLRSISEQARRREDLQRQHDRLEQEFEEQLYRLEFLAAGEDGGREEAMADGVQSPTEQLTVVIGQTATEVNQNEDTPSCAASASTHANQPPADAKMSPQKQRPSARSYMAWIFGRSTAEPPKSDDQSDKNAARVREMRALLYHRMQQRLFDDTDTTFNQQIEPTDDSVPAKLFASDRWIVTNAKDNQRDLETAIELLSEYLERDMTTQEQMVELKQTIRHKCALVDGL